MELEKRIENLVNEEYRKMKLSKKYSNNSRLYNIVSDIIYDDWGIFNDNINEMIKKHVYKLIQED